MFVTKGVPETVDEPLAVGAAVRVPLTDLVLLREGVPVRLAVSEDVEVTEEVATPVTLALLEADPVGNGEAPEDNEALPVADRVGVCVLVRVKVPLLLPL